MKKIFNFLGKILGWMFSPIVWVFKKIQNSKLGILPYIGLGFLVGFYYLYKWISWSWRTYGWWNVVVLALIAAIVLIAWGLKSGKINFPASTSTPPVTDPNAQPTRWSTTWSSFVDLIDSWFWKLALVIIIIFSAWYMWHWVKDKSKPSIEPVVAEYHQKYPALVDSVYYMEANHTYHYYAPLYTKYEFSSGNPADIEISKDGSSSNEYCKGHITPAGLQVTAGKIPLWHSGDYSIRLDRSVWVTIQIIH